MYSDGIMETTACRYAKRALQSVQPYTPGEQPARHPGLIKLNTNENPYPPSPRVLATLAAFDCDALRRYPDPSQRTLREAAAALLDVPSEWVIAGNGSDELLAMILRAFVNPGDTVAFPVPTYSLYRTLAQSVEAEVIERPVPLGAPKVGAVLDIPAAVTFIATPNAPDGYLVQPDDIARLCEARSGVGVVVVDEAYVDFSVGGCLTLVRQYDNVVITRTLSKSFSLAGLRAGIAVACPSLIQALWTVKDVYNLGALTQALATAALQDAATMRANAQRIIATRESFSAAMAQRGWHVYPSQANFIFAVPPRGDAGDLYRALCARQIYVRYFPVPMLDHGLRISIGTPEQMQTLLSALDTLA